MDKQIMNILDEFKQFPQVKAIALGGSAAASTADTTSDIDIYVFTTEDIAIKDRESIIKPVSSKYEIGGEYFGAGDEFFVDEAGVQLDVMYWNTGWFENVVKNIWKKHYPANGYTTCFLYTLNIFNIIYDPENWLINLQKSIQTPYPAQLKKNITERNMKLMMEKPFASYFEQIEKAIKRNDLNSVNHRISAFMASYFDVIFAMNEMLHPGEKRLLKYAIENCKILPADFETNINQLYNSNLHDVSPVLKEMYVQLKSILQKDGSL